MLLTITIVRWIGRITSLLLAIFLSLMAIYIVSGGKQTSGTDILGFVALLILIAGLVLSWPKEKTGIILSYAGFAAILVLMLAMHERNIQNIWYCAIPTTLLLGCRLAAPKPPRQPA